MRDGLRMKNAVMVVALGSALGGCSAQDRESASRPRFAYDGTRSSSNSNSNTVVRPPYEEEIDSEATPVTVPANPFVMTQHDPLSTFAADVDTASYDLFRRDVSAGRLPTAESVRIEEFVNYFQYAYPPPAAQSGVPFSVSLVAAPNPFGRDTTLLRVGIQGKVVPQRQPGETPANLVFLVDVSGSMAEPNKLSLVKTVLTQALGVLSPSDTLSIVTYASDTRIRLPPTPLSSRATIEQAIQGLQAGGSTAGAAGLDLAYEQAELGFLPTGINHVLLCTDGDFNVGPSSTQELLTLIRTKRDSGIDLTVLGFGSGAINDSMMEAVSDAGNGIYSVITDADQAIRYANQRLLATMTLIAKDLKIQVEFNPSQVLAYRLLGYDDRAMADSEFLNDRADAGEVGAGHRVTALYELVRTGAAIPQPPNAPAFYDGAPYSGPSATGLTDLAVVRVRYRDVPTSVGGEVREVSASLGQEQVIQNSAEVPADFQWAAAVAGLAEVLKGSPYAVPSALPDMGRMLSSSVEASDPDRVEFASLFEKARALWPPSGQ